MASRGTRLTRTLHDLDQLANSEYIASKTFNEFSPADLRKMKSDDLRLLFKKQIEQFGGDLLKTREILPNENVTRFEESEMKNMTKKLTDFREQCLKDRISVREFEEESVHFVTDNFKRYFFGSKLAKRIYQINNSIASTSLGYWGYRAVGVLGTTNRFLLGQELCKSFLPIAYFTGVTCRFWSYITFPIPPVSKFFDGVSHIAMSPIWYLEYLINKVSGPLLKRTRLRTEIPLNITGEVSAGSGLTWDKLNHTFECVRKMTENWADNESANTTMDILKKVTDVKTKVE